MAGLQEGDFVSSRDHGCLPNWREADMPEPLPFSFGNMIRTIGPGAILLAGAIGGGGLDCRSEDGCGLWGQHPLDRDRRHHSTDDL